MDPELKKQLIAIIDSVDEKSCGMSREEVLEAVGFMVSLVSRNDRVSKYQAAEMMGLSRASFDNYVRLGLIPRGSHKQGFKELSWSKRMIDAAKKRVDKFRGKT